MDKKRCCLMRQVQRTAFCLHDAVLYLDTHPCDRQAMAYFDEARAARKRAIEEYTAAFGPLTAASADPVCAGRWNWTAAPWPWKGED